MDWFLYDRDLRHERVKSLILLQSSRITNQKVWQISAFFKQCVRLVQYETFGCHICKWKYFLCNFRSCQLKKYFDCKTIKNSSTQRKYIYHQSNCRQEQFNLREKLFRVVVKRITPFRPGFLFLYKPQIFKSFQGVQNCNFRLIWVKRFYSCSVGVELYFCGHVCRHVFIYIF